jgi:hypothetical protein
MTQEVVTPEHKDFLNRELKVGDYVVFPAPRSGGMKLGKLIKFTPLQIRVEWSYKSYKGEVKNDSTTRYSKECVKVEGPDLFMYLLSGEY